MKIEVDIEILQELILSHEALQALESNGVDNWMWFDDALESYRDFEATFQDDPQNAIDYIEKMK